MLAIAGGVNGVLTEACAVLRARSAEVDEKGEFSRDNWNFLQSTGLLTLRVPRRQGGEGATISRLVNVIREIGAACPSTGLSFVMHSCAVSVIAATAAESTLSEFMPRVVRGLIVAYAGTERGTGTNFWALESSAVETDGNFHLKLNKAWATLAEVADLFVIPTRACPDAGATEISLFIVERKDGVRCPAPWTGTGMRGSSSGPVDIDAVIPKERLLGEWGRGNDYITTDMFNLLLVSHAALYLGIAEEAVKLAAARAVRRIFPHTGESLAGQSVWQSRIGALVADVSAGRALVENAAREADTVEGQRTLLRSALASKLFACGLARRATDVAMQIFGGSGYNRGERVELLWRDARAGSLMRPSDDVTEIMLGRMECGLPVFGV